MELFASVVADEARKSLRLVSKKLDSDLSEPSEMLLHLMRTVSMTLQGPPVTFRIQRTTRRVRAVVLITVRADGRQSAWLPWLL